MKDAAVAVPRCINVFCLHSCVITVKRYKGSPLTIPNFLIADFESEIRTTLRVINAVPNDGSRLPT
jgi:hypothetical protein